MPDLDPEVLIDHVKRLSDRSEVLDNVIERADRGLNFALQQIELTKGFPNAEYWTGKRDAYTAILEVILGINQ